jgi:hypothetical protein
MERLQVPAGLFISEAYNWNSSFPAMGLNDEALELGHTSAYRTASNCYLFAKGEAV